MLTREAIQTAIASKASLAGGELRSTRVSCERRAPSDEEVDRVREVLGEDAAAARIVPFCISTEYRADDGHVLKMSGADLGRYERNPVVFWSHDYRWGWRTRIANSVVSVEGGEMRALCAFLSRELSEALDDGFAWALGELAAARGHAASVGFTILSAMPAPEEVRKNIPWALDILAWELNEWSLVNIGADSHAVAEGRQAGVDVAPLGRGFARMIDELRAGGVDTAALEEAWAAAVDPGRARVHVPPAIEPSADPDPALATTEAAEDAPAVEPERAADEPAEVAAEPVSEEPPLNVSDMLRGSVTSRL